MFLLAHFSELFLCMFVSYVFVPGPPSGRLILGEGLRAQCDALLFYFVTHTGQEPVIGRADEFTNLTVVRIRVVSFYFDANPFDAHCRALYVGTRRLSRRDCASSIHSQA